VAKSGAAGLEESAPRTP